VRILIVHYRYFNSGGPERYLFNVKNALENRGHKVIPFSIKNSNNVKCEYEKYFVRNIGNSDEVFVNKYPKTPLTYLDLLSREFYSIEVKRKLENLIKAERPDVCYLMVYKRSLSPSVVDACKKYGIPVINRISDYNTVCGTGSLYRNGQFCNKCLHNDVNCLKYKCVKGSRVFSLMRYLSIKLHKMMKIDKKINAYVCTNHFMQEMMESYGYDKTKLYVIPTFFKEDNELRESNKENIVTNDCIKFLFIGNIDETKGIYDLLEALGVLKTKITNFHLAVVGGLHAEENNRVMDIVKSKGLSEYITFVPFVKGKEVFKYYLKSNITILPARWVENLPNTLVESIYFHRPVVVPRYGSFLYTTNDNVAYRYDALSSKSLEECLCGICNKPKSILEKSNACDGFFKNNFSEEIHIEKLEKLMKRIVSNENI
jgi:glycosyltransferase involved in cell wall biosynthesis